MIFRRCFMLPAAGLAMAIGCGAFAAYPERPIRIVVPQSAGGSTDLTARLVAQRLAAALRQSVVVDNRPGAGSIIGTDIVAKASPDGYTLLVVASSITLNPSLHKKLPYDVVRDLAAVTRIAAFPNMLVVHPSLPARSVADLVAHARAHPGKLDYASSGAGTGTHLSAELFMRMTGVSMMHIPFKGGAPASSALIAGQTQLMFATVPLALPHVRSGRPRALGVTTPRRTPVLPEVPSIAEAGVPGYDHTPWNGMLAPARTPAAVIALLHREVEKAVRSAELTAALAGEGAEPIAGTPQEFSSVIREETAKWAPLLRAAGIKAE